jgi:hypothetical protein
MSWESLREAYEEHGIVLALGAGVSQTSDLPNWEELLERVTDSIETSDDELFRELRNQGLPLPVIASILEERCSKRTEFVERVRDALYDEFSFYPNGVPKDDPEAIVRHVHEKNSTLRAVASLCAVRRQGAYAPNPRIRAVVTFNLDAILQAYVRRRYKTRLLRTIERPSASSTPGRISVYHMHGYLRFDRKAGKRTKEAADSVVLTEQDYFDFFNDPTSLFNYTFLYLLREYPCVRRALDAGREHPAPAPLLEARAPTRVRGRREEGEERARQAGPPLRDPPAEQPFTSRRGDRGLAGSARDEGALDRHLRPDPGTARRHVQRGGRRLERRVLSRRGAAAGKRPASRLELLRERGILVWR